MTMKKIMIIAILAIIGLSFTSCKTNKAQKVEEEIVEVADSTAVEAPADTVVVE